jgi:serine/threonine protein kinase
MGPESRLGDGRYVVVALLGEGAQGATYEATQAETGRTVAIKRFDVRGAHRWKDVELAEREARVLATLDHPLVPRYIEHFEEGGALYLVMEKVEGETLEAIRRRQGSLSEVEVRRFLASADRALTYLHGRGSPVVHRDVKPSNVVRRPDGSYVFVDFGAVSERLFRQGSSTIVGTMGYMAPEQLQGRALAASDVYAVGATALAALTGAEPETLMHKGLRVDVRAALQGRVSAELIASLERMLEPDPDLRAPSIAAALDASPMSVPSSPVALAKGTSEDAIVKSIRNLLWALWGLGWVLVPMLLGPLLGMPDVIPVVMFGWMAAILVVTWHKGALLRAAIRGWNAEGTRPATLRQRVEVDAIQEQVRVHTPDLRPEEVDSSIEVETREERARGRAP